MNKLDTAIKLYSKLRNYHGLPVWMLSFPRHLVRKWANSKSPKWLNNDIMSSSVRSDIVVSLTSFPARIEKVYLVIKCFLRQSVLPKKIILWLSEDQFLDKQLPVTLVSLCNDVFEIRFVKGDIRSHKKYQYINENFKDNLVLLVDDDLYYPSDMLEIMLNERNHTGNVVSMYASLIQYNEDGNIASYSTWKDIYHYSTSKDLFFGSGGGTLFKPSELYRDTFNIDLATKLCPTADDIWLNAMVRLANLRISKLKSGLILPILNNTINDRLCSENVDGGANDIQIKAVNDYYVMHVGKKVF